MHPATGKQMRHSLDTSSIVDLQETHTHVSFSSKKITLKELRSKNKRMLHRVEQAIARWDHESSFKERLEAKRRVLQRALEEK
jgi:hypothetical protein